MKTLLFLSWLLMGGAGYFGYNFYQQSVTDTLKSTQDLEAANASNADLTAKVTALTQQISALTTQVAEQKVKAETPVAAPVVAAEAAAPAPAPVPEIPTTITTTFGKTYTGCVLSHVTPDGISFTHSMGVAKVPFTELDPALATKFGYDAGSAKKYEADEAAHDAQSDAVRSVAEVAQAPAAAGLPVIATASSMPAAPSSTDAGNRAAKQAQIAGLQRQISSLQADAQSVDARDQAEFNSPYNIYYNSVGQVEHRRTMGHSEQGVQDRNQIVTLQEQIAALQAQ